MSTLAGLPGGSSGSANGTGDTAHFYGPSGVAVDSNGNVFVADANNHLIRQITAAGVVTTVAGQTTNSGSLNGVGINAKFNFPSGVAVDANGNLYVADAFNHTIRKITPPGVVSTFAGSPGVSGTNNGTGSAARFYDPYGHRD
ncbi:MAG: hypothetical protein WDM76_18385 [Limisphaerales bacterium]